MTGYPDFETSLASARAASRAGADLIELGVPYGDPLADGKTIREAGWDSLGRGVGLTDAFELAVEFVAGEEDPVPVALMTYYNPMLRMGLERVAETAREAGVEGFIVPDLPVDAADDWLEASAGLDTVFLAAPTSTRERLRLVGARSSGFVYCVSSLGVTGVRDELPPDLTGLVDRVRVSTDLPVAVGFGIGTPEAAARVGEIADGVVVGSAIVARQMDPDTVGEFVEAMADALDR
jgi:tryptophan synthase alpha chain